MKDFNSTDNNLTFNIVNMTIKVSTNSSSAFDLTQAVFSELDERY